MAVNRPKLIVIVGPTASGKSELAVKIAKKLALSKIEGFNGAEIISADSRQVYRGLNIGTGKILGKWLAWKPSFPVPGKPVSRFIYKDVPHHCIDFVSPKKTFTAAEFKQCAKLAIRDIAGRGKIPIIAGGTGFWINALVFDMDLPRVPPNQKLRKRLAKKSSAELLKILWGLDRSRATTIEQKNPRRLIRAIEIAYALGRVPKLNKKRDPYRALWLGLNPPRRILKKRIYRRADEMIARGLDKEVKTLLRAGVNKKRLKEFGFEYRSALSYVEGGKSRERFFSDLAADTFSYAKRQIAWFRRNRRICWVTSRAEAVRLAKKFLSR